MSTKPYLMLLLLSFVITSLRCETVYGAYQLEYAITVHANGSADWIIEQKGVGIQISFDRFMQNVSCLVKAAQAKAERDMTVPTESFLMTANVSGSYKIVRYQFSWDGFAKVEGSRIKIGDVFEVEGFFTYLYGDGTVCIRYPPRYVVESVFPAPHKQNSSIRILEWYGIEDFGTGQPKIVFKEESAPPEVLNATYGNAILITGLLALIGGGSIGLYYFKFKRKELEKDVGPKMLEAQKPVGIENDEEKVINLLKTAGGRLYQSTIADQCRFSRSKTSKLLKAMEEKGKIKREEKGRVKVVTLLEEVKDDR